MPEGATSGPCDFAIKAIVAGEFQFPEGAELVSAVYAISASRRLIKPVKIEIQHCAAIKNGQQGGFLAFVRAQCNQKTLPYEFQILNHGTFGPQPDYGIITCDGFSLLGIVIPVNIGNINFRIISMFPCIVPFAEEQPEPAEEQLDDSASSNNDGATSTSSTSHTEPSKEQ